MQKLNIGVMGCANIAERSVIPAIKALPEKFNLVAIASRNINKAKKFAKDFNCEPVKGYQELIDRDDIDAIYMPLPTGLHLEWIIKALDGGKHIYAEKSIALSNNDAIKMIEKAKDKNLALMEGYMFLYHSQHQLVNQIINSDKIGDLRCIRSSFGFPPLPDGNFRYDDKIGGGVLFDAAGYPLRATRMLLGSDTEVTAAQVFIDPELKTGLYGNAFLQNKNKVAAQISFGFDNYYQCNYEIWGSKGKLTATRAFTPKPDFNPEIIVETQEGVETITAETDNHFVNAMREFFNICIGFGRESHYKNILIQSKGLQDIKELSEQKG